MMKNLQRKTEPKDSLELAMSSLNKSLIEVYCDGDLIRYAKSKSDNSNDKYFKVKLRKTGFGPDVSKFNSIFTDSHNDTNFAKETLKGEHVTGIEENSTELITTANFDEKIPDDLFNFLICLCKCLELSDECCSACLIENRILLTFNNIRAGSLKSNDQMTSILEFIKIILNYDFNSDEDYKLLYNYMCKIKDHAIKRSHSSACGFKEETLDRYSSMLKKFQWVKNAKTDSVFDDPRVENALCNFAVCFNRVIRSSHLNKLKNGIYKIGIVGNGYDVKHAEIRLMRYLVKTYETEKNKIKNLFIATSKRPCFYCDKILREYPKSKFKLSFTTRKSSQIMYQKYREHWPRFLKELPDHSSTFEYFDKKYHHMKIPTPMNASTSFKFEEIEKNGDIEQRLSRLEKENAELRKENAKLIDKIGDLERRLSRLEKENAELREENAKLKKEN